MIPVTDEAKLCLEYLDRRQSSTNRFATRIFIIDMVLFAISILFALISGSVASPWIFYAAISFYILGILLGLFYLISITFEVGVIIKKGISKQGLLDELLHNEDMAAYLAKTFRQETLQSLLVFFQRKIIGLAARRMSMLQLLTIFGGAWFLNEKRSALLIPFFPPSIIDLAGALALVLIPLILALSSGLMIGIFSSLIFTEKYSEYIEHLKHALGTKKDTAKPPFLHRRPWISSVVRRGKR